jgi:hypothetical protein
VDTGPPTAKDSASDAPAVVADSSAPDSAPVDSGPPGPDATDAGPPPFDAGPPVCDPDASVGQPQEVLNLVPDSVYLGGVTPDEMVMAWTLMPADGGAVAIQWAERADAGPSTLAPFGAIQSLDPMYGPFAADNVSLSGDGLRLVFPTADHTSVVEVSRSARGTPFNTITTATDFVEVNPVGGPEGTPGIGPFSSSALSPKFSYWAFVQGANGIVMTNALGSGQWLVPPARPPGLFPPASGAATVFPTAWSSDDRTLFYWDSVFGKASIAWRDPLSSTIIQVEDIGTQKHAVPSGDCKTIYFSGSLGIYASPRN